MSAVILSQPADAPAFGDVAAHPAVVTVSVILGCILVAAQMFPRIAGPLRQGLEAWSLSVRRAQDTAKAAIITDLEDEVDRYQGLVGDLRGENARLRRSQATHDSVLVVHARWDQAQITKVIRLGGDADPAPPLWPVCPETGQTTAPAGNPDIEPH